MCFARCKKKKKNVQQPRFERHSIANGSSLIEKTMPPRPRPRNLKTFSHLERVNGARGKRGHVAVSSRRSDAQVDMAVQMRNCIIAPSANVFARRYEALAWFLPGDFHLVSLSFSHPPHLSLSIDTRSLLFASRHPGSFLLVSSRKRRSVVDRTRFQTSSPSLGESKGSSKIVWIIRLSVFTADTKA